MTKKTTMSDANRQRLQELRMEEAQELYEEAEAARQKQHARVKPLGDELDKLGTDSLIAALRDARKAVAYDIDLSIPLDRVIDTLTTYVVPMQKRIATLAEPLPEPTLDEAG